MKMKLFVLLTGIALVVFALVHVSLQDEVSTKLRTDQNIKKRQIFGDYRGWPNKEYITRSLNLSKLRNQNTDSSIKRRQIQGDYRGWPRKGGLARALNLSDLRKQNVGSPGKANNADRRHLRPNHKHHAHGVRPRALKVFDIDKRSDKNNGPERNSRNVFPNDETDTSDSEIEDSVEVLIRFHELFNDIEEMLAEETEPQLRQRWMNQMNA
ncbi:unnamed protein product [Phyllotreta striolata]|uniref:Uncharacterized protein n=1 Tax=Phyllotreta striolata TaxID=444603 RepID=A0A9N9TV09_PHYSR|nr:unnamed protein product [Phyllotreta striolata]